MSTITKEQMLKWAAAWQVVMTYVIFYVNEFGVDTTNRLIFGIALFVGFLITFLKKDNTAKVVTAVGTVKDFIDEHKEPTEDEKKVMALDYILDLFGLKKGLQPETTPGGSEEEIVTELPSDSLEREIKKESFKFGT